MQPEDWKKIKQLLDQALSLEKSERAGFLKNCGASAEVCAEVESLLLFEDESERLLERSAIEFSKDFFDEEDKEISFLGQSFGAYRTIRELGFGGMGAVYLAERVDGKFSQRVALKLLKREMNTAALRQRFEQERAILASLEHPNIARLLDAGTTGDGIPYIAMEYVEGVPIDDFCNANNLDLDQRLNLFRKICAAVGFAHRNLIVHRDLKPSNVLVTKDGSPKLLDFGISKILSSELEQTRSATITKLGVMTPSYASPEQMQNKSVTTATDIYSLGVILYELLSGHRPFEPKEKDFNEIYKAVLEEEPAPPSEIVKTISKNFRKKTDAKPEIKSLEKPATKQSVIDTEANDFSRTFPQTINLDSNSLRGDLDNIALKALRKEPERRYSSAENFAEDIERHQDGLPVAARPNTFAYRAEKFIKRNQLAAATAILILLTIVGGIGATLWQARRAEAQRVRAENRFTQVRSLANSFLFEITPEIETLSGSTRAKELLVNRALEYLDSLSAESDDAAIQRELAAAYEKVGDVQGNPFEANIGDMRGALASYEKARAIRVNLLEKNPSNLELKIDLAKNTQLIGDILFNSGEQKKAAEKYAEAVRAQEEILQTDPSNAQLQFNLAAARFALGTTFFWNSEYDEALKHYMPAKETFENLNKNDPANETYIDRLANSYIRIGETIAWQDKLEDGQASIQKGLTMIAPLAERHPNNARFRKTLWAANIRAGEIFLDWEKFDKCLEHWGKAVDLAKQMVAQDPKNVVAKRDLALSLNKVGDTLDSSGKGAEAFEHSSQALKLQQEIAEADPQNFEIRRQIAGTFKRMGYAQTTMKDHAGSRASFEKAMRQYEELIKLDPNDQKLPREIAIVSQTIGETYVAEADEKDKSANLQKALEWLEKSRALFIEMKEKGTLPEFDFKQIGKVETAIADVRRKLGKV